MANTKSAIKAARKTERFTARNKTVKTRLKTLHKKLQCDRLSFGRPELLMQVLGVPAGAVTPFALINDTGRRVTVILDADMMRHERLNYHPLENTATTNIAREDLLRFIRSCGHQPRTLAVAGGV